MKDKFDVESVRRIYAFLRNAMRLITSDHPYRGPKEFAEGDFIYADRNEGEIGLHPSDGKNSSGVARQVTYWRVSDIQKSIAYFESHGCSKYRGPIFGVDQVWVCQVKDPFENVWGLVQRPQP